MKPKTYFDCYKTWCKAGRLPKGGLCNSLPDHLFEKKAFNMMHPTEKDVRELINSGYPVTYWGAGDKWSNLYMRSVSRTFTPLRQNLILFAALLNNEKI